MGNNVTKTAIKVATPHGEIDLIKHTDETTGNVIYEYVGAKTGLGYLFAHGHAPTGNAELTEPLWLVLTSHGEWYTDRGVGLGKDMERFSSFVLGHFKTIIEKWHQRAANNAAGENLEGLAEVMKKLVEVGEGPFDGDLKPYGCKVNFTAEQKVLLNAKALNGLVNGLEDGALRGSHKTH